MEELTIEEKAKAYDEAINVAKSKIKNDKDHVLYENDIIEIFPELVESEDEWICRKLIAFLKQCKAVYGDGFKQFGLDIDDALAWLEKQGEHANFRNKIQIGDKVTRNQDGILVNLSQLNRVAKKDEKQGEQKPNPYSGTSFEYNGHTYGMCARDNGVDILIDSKLKTHVSLDTNQNPAWSEVIYDDRKDWTEEEWQKYYEFLAEQEESINELKDNG